MIQQFIDRLFGNYNQKQIRKIQQYLPLIEAAYEEFEILSDRELKQQFADWKQTLTASPEKIEDLLVPVFAGIKSAACRLGGHTYEVRGKTETWNMVHYEVQLIGGIVLHQGKITEMKTGEGKTLVSTLPIILNALTGKAVHVVTVND